MDTNYCCLCNNPVNSNNFLLDGRKFHDRCINKLKGSYTQWNTEIKFTKEKIYSKRSKINSILNTRSFFQKLFGNIPNSVNQIKNEIEQLNAELNRYKRLKQRVLDEKKKKLSELYDYWPTRPPDWDNRSYQLRYSYGYCQNCGARKSYNNPLQVHHIIPVSQGGNHKPKNLEVICLRCHKKKHKFDIEGENSNRSSRVNDNLSLINQALNSNKYLKFKHRLFEKTYDKHIVKVKEVYHEGVPRIKAHCYLNDFERQFRIDKLSKIEILSELPKTRTPADFIEEALGKDLMIHCHYTKRTGGKSLRTLKPTGYTSFKSVKVLECFDFLTDEYRNFSPHRMKNLELVEEPKEQKLISGTP